MNRRELLNATAAHTGLEPKVVDQVLKGLTEVITAVNAKGEPVAISGFAKFARVDRPARMGRNPATGEPVKIKASKKAKITPLKAYKEGVMTASGAPKLAKGVWPPAASPSKAVSNGSASKASAAKAPAAKATASKAATKAPAAKAPAAKATAASRATATKATTARRAPAKKA